MSAEPWTDADQARFLEVGCPGNGMYEDCEGFTLACKKIVDLEARLSSAEAALKTAREALECIGEDEDSLACSDIPHCQGIGPHGHAEDCAVGIARAALASLHQGARE